VYALTVKQPWAQAIARFGKDVENRTRRPPARLIGQRIAIHAGRADDEMEAMALVYLRDGYPVPVHLRALVEWLVEWIEEHGSDVPQDGRIVATARLAGWCDRAGNVGWAETRDADGKLITSSYDRCGRAIKSPWRTDTEAGLVLADVVALPRPVGAPSVVAYTYQAPPIVNVAPGQFVSFGDPKSTVEVVQGRIRGQLGFWQLSPEVEAEVLRQEQLGRAA
jgi:hypothetical protein